MEVGVNGRVGACSWADRPWKFPLCVSALFRMGGVWSWSLGLSWGKWLGWGLGTWQQASHSRKLASFTRTKKAALDSAWLSEHSTPIITQKNRNSEMRSAQVVAHIDCCLLTAALNIHISLFYVDKVKGISQMMHFLCFLSAESLPDFHLIMSYSSLNIILPDISPAQKWPWIPYRLIIISHVSSGLVYLENAPSARLKRQTSSFTEPKEAINQILF